MEVPHYESRQVEISFTNWSRLPVVHADGPGSPHRYTDDNSLCMWYPHDPPERKWVFEDGLVALLNIIQAHLFSEAWWRETGEWPGDEVPHAPVKEPVKEETERDAGTPDPRHRYGR